jgi:two-component system, LuxR family, sensor kinase FixL
LAAGARERYGVECTCGPDGESPRCDVATATHLYRIAPEAVNNALKHSGARHISISLAASDGALALDIRDDGKGFGSSPPREGGMGLHIMDYRARLIGGVLRLQSGGSGTAVSCRVPSIL